MEKMILKGSQVVLKNKNILLNSEVKNFKYDGATSNMAFHPWKPAKCAYQSKWNFP